MRRISTAISLFILIAVAGCGKSSGSVPPPTIQVASATSVGLQAVVASSDLSVGRNRFTFGLLDSNHPVEIGSPRLTFFSLHGNQGTAMAHAVASFNQFARGLKATDANQAAIDIGGVFVATVKFASAGQWGVEIRTRIKGRDRLLRQTFKVRPRSLTPALGSPAPRSLNPTVNQVPATKLDSARPPDDMHRLSIASAIAQRKPLVVLFATAAYCTSRLCGPQIETVKALQRRYRGRVNFVHIEVYRDANPARGYAPTFLQWHLPTEPWVFVVNRHGVVAAKFEGPTPTSEIVPVLQSTLRA